MSARTAAASTTAQQATGPVPSSELRPVGPHLVVAPDNAIQGPLAESLAALSTGARTLVVLTAARDAAAVLRRELAEVARIAKERGVTTLVLATPGLAAAGSGGPRPAELLADVLGLAVVAPDGVVSLLSDGRLKVVAGATGTPASWWRCAPAQPSTRLGDTWPEPQAVRQHLPPVGPAVVTEIANGYWITSAPSEQRPGALGDAWAGEGTVTVVVGSPESPTVRPEQLAEAVRPRTGQGSQVVLSAPWSAPAPLYDMAARLAEDLDEEVLVSLGLPMPTASGGQPAAFRSLGLQGGCAPVYLDADGCPTWEPYLTKLTAARDRRWIVPTSWRRPVPGATCVGPAVFEAFPGWELEAVPSGLWLRQEGAAEDGEPRFRAADPQLPLLMVGEKGRSLPTDIWENVGELLKRLPQHAEEPLGLMIRGTADTASRSASRLTVRAFDLVPVDPDTQPGEVARRSTPARARRQGQVATPAPTGPATVVAPPTGIVTTVPASHADADIPRPVADVSRPVGPPSADPPSSVPAPALEDAGAPSRRRDAGDATA
ncbi:hypothetical protein [Streptomyces lunalinharesii]|uniref:Basic proline-rich protein n=1 Tax=Streptomyces lunalinharesii TaxID=333384 RepID=A0ABP6EYX1_9ACTN